MKCSVTFWGRVMARQDNPLFAIAQIRAAAAMLEHSTEPVLKWIAAKLESYEQGAPGGLTLDQAFGVTQHGGVCSWWAQEARKRRDKACRELRKESFANCDIKIAAKEIDKLARRRMTVRTAPINRVDLLIDEALCSGAKFPSPQQLRTILADNRSDD